MPTPGEILTEHRINAGLSIRALAREIGIDQETVRGYGQDRYVPTPKNAKKVADRFGVAVTSIWPPEAFTRRRGTQ